MSIPATTEPRPLNETVFPDRAMASFGARSPSVCELSPYRSAVSKSLLRHNDAVGFDLADRANVELTRLNGNGPFQAV
jgi:hypothetical protein